MAATFPLVQPELPKCTCVAVALGSCNVRAGATKAYFAFYTCPEKARFSSWSCAISQQHVRSGAAGSSRLHLASLPPEGKQFGWVVGKLGHMTYVLFATVPLHLQRLRFFACRPRLRALRWWASDWFGRSRHIRARGPGVRQTSGARVQ